MTIRQLWKWGCACLLLAAAWPAVAQNASFPDRPVKIIVPFPAGGSADGVSRLLADKLTQIWKQPVITENKPGGGTLIGLNAIAKAVPDGYTVGIDSISHIVQPAVRRNLPFRPIEDFEFVTRVMEAPFVLTVNAKLPIHDLKELLAYTKANPGKLNYASFGVGSAGHIFFEILSQQTGIKAEHIPYKGTGEATTAQIAGDVALHFDAVTSNLPFIKSGKLRALLVTTAARYRGLPDVPTSREAGIPALEMPTWFGVVAPRGVPPETVRKLNAGFVEALQLPDVQSALYAQGLTATPSSPDEFRSFAVRSLDSIRSAARTGNIPMVDN